MSYWVTPSEMAGLDRVTIAKGVPGEVLMERAGEAIAAVAARMIRPGEGPVEVWAGPGNNGGDGFVVARLLLERGFGVRVIAAFDRDRQLPEESEQNRRRFEDLGGELSYQSDHRPLPGAPPALMVDALLGTGFRGYLRDDAAEAAGVMRGRRCPVLAVDTPSGLNGETGDADPGAVRADVTVTLACPKIGLLLPPGCALVGTLILADIGIAPPSNADRLVMDVDLARGLLPRRPVDAHKGIFGRVLLLGGCEEMPGAPMLMTMGALRAGAGLVELCVPLPAAPAVAGRIPEALFSYFLPGDVTSMPDPESFTCAAIGPGMGDSVSTRKVMRHILTNWSLPLVLDADALNSLSGDLGLLSGYGSPLILTPHPGELRRLTGEDSKGLKTRWEAASRLAEGTGSVVVLKGRPSAVFHPSGGRILIPSGNNGLATGGSGDVLTGMIVSLLGQGMDAGDAAALGAYLHGLAADIAVSRTSRRSLIPTDVVAAVGAAYALIEDTRNNSLLHVEGSFNGRLWHHP
ncbi:NAD(P)H-hydrate dehydratase [Candidatus Fermentibacterales bacterium]|nr:NAD(P)H-hydrate dehydratase [Candidatus Fermentibacterales bacterium]